MQDVDIKNAWLSYSSKYPHQWQYLKNSQQYKNQISVVNGKAIGNKPNLYCLFTEQCFNLLKPNGECGIVIPSGIYTDLGTKQLRKMLFEKTKITGLFCFENRKTIFEGVHRSFKFVVLTFVKKLFYSLDNSNDINRHSGRDCQSPVATDGISHPCDLDSSNPCWNDDGLQSFPAAFMRHEVSELNYFPNSDSLVINTDLIKKLSPDSYSIIEFKNAMDVHISEKFSKFPLLYNDENGWQLELYGEEMNMTRSADYFLTTPTECPLYEGGVIWHFTNKYSEPRYWINEQDIREDFLSKRTKRIEGLTIQPNDLKNDYEVYRLAIRKIASNTNERTLITTIIPKYVIAGNSLTVSFPFYHDKNKYNELRLKNEELLVVCAILNSFVVDFILRSSVTTNLNLFYLYQLPIPRLTKKHPLFKPIVERAAALICTTPEFDDLRAELDLSGFENLKGLNAGDIRAELDAMIAHLYGLNEAEFAHILATFPIVKAEVKAAALAAFNRLSVC
jgi:hypothetical protein